MTPLLRLAAAPLAALALAACNPAPGDGDEAAAAAPEPSSRTLAASLKADGELDSLEGALLGSGLDGVLEGVGPYTVFAPTDQAFRISGLGDLSDEALKAQSAALIRAHVVPGALTRADLAAAVDREGSGQVEVRTMANEVLTLSRDGDAIVVTAPDGATGRLTGAEALASNGVVQPVDGVLVKSGD